MVMAHEEDKLPAIEPPIERWEPKSDPSLIEIPELNASAPPQEQLEQLDQIITIRLQNIDANMSRAHYILSEKILPTVKRYNLNTEPVREAAQFWIQLFEQAARIRIPGPEDLSFGLHPEEEGPGELEVGGDEDEQMRREEEETHSHSRGNVDADGHRAHGLHTFDPDVTPAESSFAPEHAAVSSTPFAPGAAPSSRAPAQMWTESPLERLDKGLQSLRAEDGDDTVSARRGALQDSVASDASTALGRVFSVPAPGKGKGKEKATLLQNVLTKNIQDSTTASGMPASPTKGRKTPRKNPFAPANGPQWDGIVDLTVHAPSRKGGGWSSGDEEEAGEADEFGDFDVKRMQQRLRSPAKRGAPQIGRTPRKEAAMRIGRDLVGDAERGQYQHQHHQQYQQQQQRYRNEGRQAGYGYGYGSEDPTQSTPSLSNYSKRALGIEDSATEDGASLHSHSRNTSVSDAGAVAAPSIGQRFGLDPGGGGGGGGVGDDSFDDSFDDDTMGPVFQGLNTLAEDPGNEDDVSGGSSEEDSFTGMNPHAGPSAAFLLASARQRRETGDSFGGSDHSSDSLDGDEGAGAVPIHPFAQFGQVQGGDESFEDSFDAGRGGGNVNADESTVFGVRPVRRGGQRLTLLGQHLVDETEQLTGESTMGRVPETPTPANQQG